MKRVDDVNTNVDDPNRHNVGGSMNRPVRNDDPLAPRNYHSDEPLYDEEILEPTFAENVNVILGDLEQMLISKNMKYGNSALEPTRIFSKASPVEQILVRLDDKLSRISNRQDNEDEDVVNDLLGYLVLLKIALKENSKNN